MSTRTQSTTLVTDDVQDHSSPLPAPFATPTLARLYQAQGHHDEARRLARRLQAAGAHSVSVEARADSSSAEEERRQRLLQGLLARVQANKR